MHSIINAQLLIPIGLLVFQNFLLLFITVAALKRFKILKTPYAGLEYSNLIVSSAYLFGVFFISTGDITGLFQVFKTFQNSQQQILSNTFSKFSQFVLVILFFQLLFGIVSFFIIKLLFGFKNSMREIEEGNIPGSILMAVIVLSFSIIFQFCAKEVIEYITPQYLNFR